MRPRPCPMAALEGGGPCPAAYLNWPSSAGLGCMTLSRADTLAPQARRGLALMQLGVGEGCRGPFAHIHDRALCSCSRKRAYG